MSCCKCCQKSSGRHRKSLRQSPSVYLKSTAVLKELTAETYPGFHEHSIDPGKRCNLDDFFVVGNILGCGENSIVFHAVFKPTNENVAIKYINDYTKDRKGISRELHVLKLPRQCPHLVAYHSHFRIREKCYIVTEELSKLNFYTILHPNSTLPPALIKIYMKQLCSAIMFLHDQKIIHRDITLKNLMLDNIGNLRLIDYNLSRTVNDPMGMSFSDIGSFKYAAPEIYKDKMCSYPVDWWSVGVVLYRFITGGFPYPTNSSSVYSYYVIKSHRVVYPAQYFHDDSLLYLTEKFLATNQSKRLGSKNSHDVMNHAYFADTNWNKKDNVRGVILGLHYDDLARYRDALKGIMSVIRESMGQGSTSRDVLQWEEIETAINEKSDRSNSSKIWW